MSDKGPRMTGLAEVPGVRESTLDAQTAGSLPAQAPPAPWECDSCAILWLGRGRGVRDTVGTLLPGGVAMIVVGGMISYRRTPVGPYHEVFGGVGLRTGRRVSVSIPFMAVDSPDSVVGGRQNWSLPKVLAEFSGQPGAGATMTAIGDGWTLHVTAHQLGPRLPVQMTGKLVQRWSDGVFRAAVLTGRAKARPALVRVEVASSGQLGSWLRPGRHLGAILTDATFTVPAAE